jgi:AcrR family transcriptional regulator
MVPFRAMAGAARAEESGRSSRRSADDWLRAAFDIMVDEGITGVKIHRLCERLGVTKGSFYWHFADLDAFLTELARRWAEEGMRVPARLESSADPGAKLLQAMQAFADRRNRQLTRAVRDWAQNDERAKAAILKADTALFETVRNVIAGMGFDEDEAEVRAKVLFYAGVGFAHVGTLGRRQTAHDQLAATWDLITRR